MTPLRLVLPQPWRAWRWRLAPAAAGGPRHERAGGQLHAVRDGRDERLVPEQRDDQLVGERAAGAHGVATLRVGGSWRYLGRKRTLEPGDYRWFVWAALGTRERPRFGRPLGSSTFTVRQR